MLMNHCIFGVPGVVLMIEGDVFGQNMVILVRKGMFLNKSGCF
jgi:hypothetical protein